MGALEDEGTLVVDQRQLGFANPYGIAVLAELRRRDIPFVCDDPGLTAQLGPERRYDGRNGDARLLVTFGDRTRTPGPGERRVALHDGLSGDEQAELAQLREDIEAHILAAGLLVRDPDSAAVEQARATTGSDLGPGTDATGLFATRQLVALVEGGELAPGRHWEKRFERYARLQRQWDEHTVALSLAAIG
jgi:hypothetical protein